MLIKPSSETITVGETDHVLDSAYNKMLKGNIDGAVESLVENGKNEFENFVKSINSALEENREHSTDVKDRGFWKALFSSNTKDLGSILFEQNTLLSALFVLIRLQGLSGEACSKMLSDLYTYAGKEADTTGQEKNNIQNAIIATLEKNVQEFKLDEIRDKALMKLLKAAENSAKFEKDMRVIAGSAKKSYEDSEQKILKDTKDFKKAADEKIKGLKEWTEKNKATYDKQIADLKVAYEEELSNVRKTYEAKEVELKTLVDNQIQEFTQDAIQREKRLRRLCLSAISISGVSILAVIGLIIFL